MRTSWPGKIFLFCFSFGAVLFLLFCSLEIFPSLPAKLKLNQISYYALKERYIADPDLVIRTRPGYHYRGFFGGDLRNLLTNPKMKFFPYDAQYDGDGFRNRYGSGKTDAVFLGDSYLEIGANDEDTLSARLEKKSGLKSANYGIGWYGPYQYLEVLKRYGLRNRPHFAVFCFFEGNDPGDIREYTQWKNGGNYYGFRPLEGPLWKRFLWVLREIIKIYFYTPPLRVPPGADPRLASIQLKGKTIETAFAYGPEKQNLPQIAEAMTKLGGILQEFQKICRDRGIQPVFLFIPDNSHIYLPYAQMPAVSNGELQKRTAARHDLEKAVREITERLSIRWISLTKPFEKAAAEGKYLYYETDTHWNSEGRELAAEVLAAVLPAA